MRTRFVLAGLMVATLVILGQASAQHPEQPQRQTKPIEKNKPVPGSDERAREEMHTLRLITEGFGFIQKRRFADALPKFEQALALGKKLYPPTTYPKGHVKLVMSLLGLGAVHQAQGNNDKALLHFEEALAMSRQLGPDGDALEPFALNNLGVLLNAQGKQSKAERYLEQALAVHQRLYPKERFPEGHHRIAESLSNLGGVLQAQGKYDKALPYYEQALPMMERLYAKDSPQGHPNLAICLNSLGHLLEAQGEFARALPYLERAVAMCQRLYPREHFPQGHPDLATSLNNLGLLFFDQGEYAKALPYLEKSLAMRQQLFPKEPSPESLSQITNSLHNLGDLLLQLEEYDKAKACHERALAIRQQLYARERFPQGHFDLVMSLHSLGGVLKNQGRNEEALSCCEQALTMCKQLSARDGSPQCRRYLATSLNNLGTLLRVMGRYEKAMSYLEEAVVVFKQVYAKERYPEGHPELATCLYNVGSVLQAEGQSDKALPYLEQGLAMSRNLGDRFVAVASEAEALALLRAQSTMPGAYLSAATQIKTPAAIRYARLWPSRALLSRVLQRRHLAILVASAHSDEVRGKWQDLLDTRRKLAVLVIKLGGDLDERTHELARLTDRKERLERELAALLPDLMRSKELDRLGPIDLAGLLPPRTAFVDLVRYTHIGKEIKPTIRYGAFVVRPDRTIRWVELKDAQPIDEAVRAWRLAIAKLEDGPAHAERVARLVWEPLAQELRAGTTTVYLATDGELARLPWAALPGSKPGTVLLEDLTIAVVPHGPFLLEQLKYPPHIAAGKESVLALGDVDYGPVKQDGYKPLAGTAAEVRQVFAVAGTRNKKELTKERATWAGLKEALPQAGYAHLATHGFFNADALLQEHQRVERRLKTWEFQPDRPTQRLGLGLRSPLSYTGLVLAGANLPAQAQDGGIVTGEALVELPLEGLRLCVLSACESGVGSLTGVAGEGVQGLPRAFHLAGCPIVISSLWNVNDKATAALMSRFYHELWKNGNTPLEALRQAQLTILRHPEWIDDLADRGRPNFSRLVAAPADVRVPPGETAHKRAPTKLWAAFVLSGVGR